jgi:subtilisin-like proprotein convertase family protein
MVRDSIYCNQNLSITDINLFVATNHTYAQDMEIALIGPQGDSVAVCYDWAQRLSDDNIITVFDDEADSAYTGGGRQLSFGPVIRPAQSLTGGFSGTNTEGWWILHITDDAGGDTGRLYGWGFQINNQTVVGVDDAPSMPEVFRLAQNYPNPFNPATVIEYDIPHTVPVTLEIFDILGRLVETPVNAVQAAGTYRVSFAGRGAASGTYFYRLTAGEFVQTRKMILVK